MLPSLEINPPTATTVSLQTLSAPKHPRPEASERQRRHPAMADIRSRTPECRERLPGEKEESGPGSANAQETMAPKTRHDIRSFQEAAQPACQCEGSVSRGNDSLFGNGINESRHYLSWAKRNGRRLHTPNHLRCPERRDLIRREPGEAPALLVDGFPGRGSPKS